MPSGRILSRPNTDNVLMIVMVSYISFLCHSQVEKGSPMHIRTASDLGFLTTDSTARPSREIRGENF